MVNSAYSLSMELCGYVKHNEDCSPEEVERLWKRIFEAVLIREKFTRSAIDYMWKNLAQGNWEHFHLTEEETQRTSSEWLEEFELDVFYCSDRWSLDRLTRCHWMWREYDRACKKKGVGGSSLPSR